MNMNANSTGSVNTTSLLGELFLFEGHAVRIYGTAEDPLFVAQDVCEAIEIANARDAVKSLETDETRLINVGNADGIRGNPNMHTLTESGVYALIFKSRKPEAIRFRRWVTGQVLPAIRKQGFYSREGMDGRLARIERAKSLRARRQALLAEAKSLATEIARLEDLGADSASVAEVLGTDHAPLSAINRCLAFARRNAVPVGRRSGRTILPRTAIVTALGLDQGNLPLN